jgi:predicted ATP-grasp superfamily ATP-dependent carboligase
MKVLTATTCRPDDRIALCAIRALAAGGVEVSVGGDRFAGRAFFSKHIQNRFRYPHPTKDPRGFQDALIRHVTEEGFDAVLPVSDYVVGALSEVQDQLESAVKLALPSCKAQTLFRDKLETIRLAGDLGISTPKTVCCEAVQDLPLLLESREFPLIIKPRKGTGGIGLFRLDTPVDLPKQLFTASIPSDTVFDAHHLLVQEFIPGKVHDVCVLFNRGEPRAVLTQKRLTMYPAKGGVGIYNVTTDEADIKEQAIALLKAAEWHGPAQVEFKRKADGSPCLMEVNGRFWGTLDLAVAAGVNFPLLTCRMAVDGDVKPVSSYEVGLGFRWPVPYGLLHAFETGRWMDALWKFWGPRKGVKSDMRISDPLPLAAEAVFALKRIGSLKRGHFSGRNSLLRIHSVRDRGRQKRH